MALHEEGGRVARKVCYNFSGFSLDRTAVVSRIDMLDVSYRFHPILKKPIPKKTIPKRPDTPCPQIRQTHATTVARLGFMYIPLGSAAS